MRRSLKFYFAFFILFFICQMNVMAIEIDLSTTQEEIDTYQKHGHRSELWDDLLTMGFKQYINGELDSALLTLQKAYDFGCRDGLLLYRLATCYAKNDICDKTIFYAKEAIQALKERYPDHYYGKTVYQILGDCSKGEAAIDFYNQGLEKDPSNVSMMLNKALKLIEIDKLIEAEEQINVVLNDYGDKVSDYGLGVAYHALGESYHAKGDYYKALAFFKSALDFRNRPTDAWWLALTYEKIQNYKKAVYYWYEAAELYKSNNSEWSSKALKRAKELENYISKK